MGIVGVWLVLASLYTLPLFLAAYLSGRMLTIPVCFRMNLLSLMPPAFFMTAALLLYGLGQLNLQEWILAFLEEEKIC